MSHHVLILISSLQTGGAERVASMLANYWCNNGYHITMVLLDSSEQEKFYPIENEVNIINLDVLGDSSSYAHAIKNNIHRLIKIRKTVKQCSPDIVLSLVVETNILAILSMIGLKIPLLVADHADPHLTPQGKLWRKLRDILYPLADAVVLLDDYFSQFYIPSIQKKCVVIPNPVKECDKAKKTSVKNNTCQIISVGRFVEEKRFDRLLNAFALVVAKYPDAILTLVGDGEYRAKLEALRDSLCLQHSVIITGYVSNPEAYLSKSDIFVLTSDSEGFPMVLCEAMSCGLPVVTTEYHAGVRTLIKNGENGFVVGKTPNMLANKINKLIEDQSLRETMGMYSQQSIKRYSIQSVNTQWQGLFDRMING